MITVRRSRVAAGAVAAAPASSSPRSAPAPGEPAAMFSTRRSSCHTYGQETRVVQTSRGDGATPPRLAGELDPPRSG